MFNNPIAYVPPGTKEDERFEKTYAVIFQNASDGSIAVANEIAKLIRQKEATNKPCVLGLATGSSPASVYSKLVRMHKEEGLSFKNVYTFNLDEYYPMQPNSLQSYVRFKTRFTYV